ncbi:MAG: response regulator [Chitinivibrionales bacterium]|nr:response regulator [Chitinivibrionales bacterium]
MQKRTPIRILLIDDDEDIRRIMHQLLKSEGYVVTEAADGRIGLNLFFQAQFDVILVDMSMPEKNGLETIKEMRQNNKSVKIIAISGIDWNQTITQLASQCGANSFIEKPIDLETVLTSINKVLKDGN